MNTRSVGLKLLLLAAVSLSASTGHAWESSSKWADRVVPFRVNPSNLDMSNADALAGIRWSAAAWTNQSQAGFRFQYAGASTKTNLAFDSENVVLFRDAFGTTTTTRGTTYTWIQSGNIIEADMIFWDRAVTFIPAGDPCSGQIVLENTAIHEFGHALGLDHSTRTAASMYATDSACSEARLTLHADDITGVETLYPCGSNSQCNDSDSCTADSCRSNECQYAPIAGCCNTNADCNDANACTTDTCKAKQCQHAAVANCCTSKADCDDADACTTDSCKSNKCQYAAVANCCNSKADCDDADACTTDSCKSNKCQHAAVANCCTTKADCDDADACTTDSCKSNKCQHAAVPGCGDAGGAAGAGAGGAGTGGSGSGGAFTGGASTGGAVSTGGSASGGSSVGGAAGAAGSNSAGSGGVAGSWPGGAGDGGSWPGPAGGSSSGGALASDAGPAAAGGAMASRGNASGQDAGCGCRVYQAAPLGSTGYALALGGLLVFGRRRQRGASRLSSGRK